MSVLLLAAAPPVMSVSCTLPWRFRESEGLDIWTSSSSCGSEEETICSGKHLELSCTIGKEGAGCMKRKDEKRGIWTDGAG